MNYYPHPTASLTPDTPEIVVRRCEVDFIQFTWGDASNIPGFNRYLVSLNPPQGTRTFESTRQVTYSNLTPGTRYEIRVQADATNDITETLQTQTSKY